jgi:hypothetical protein
LRIPVVCLLSLAAMSAEAQCWRVAEIKGYSSRASEGYTLSADGFTGREFEITVQDRGGSVSPSSLKCERSSPVSLLCIDSKSGKVTVETWVIDEVAGRVLHTKSITGYGIHDGGNLFVGRVLGKCRGR